MAFTAPSRPAALPLVQLMGLFLLFPRFFAGPVLGGMFAVHWFKGTPLTDEQTLLIGVIFGLVIALFLAVFHVKREIICLPYHDRQTLLNRVRQPDLPVPRDLGHEAA